MPIIIGRFLRAIIYVFAKAPKVGFMQVQKPESANKAYGYSRDSGSSRQPAKEAVK